MDLTDEEKVLLESLRTLGNKLRSSTKAKYSRINPFIEDIFDWKERGRHWTGFPNVTIYNSATVSGDVSIGPNTWIGPFCSLDGSGGLTIGEFCSISAGTQIITHDSVRWCLSGGKEKYEYSPVTIGDRSFIGTNSIIIRGVQIGSGSVVGAGSVVTRDIPSGYMAAGSPAKILRKIT